MCFPRVANGFQWFPRVVNGVQRFLGISKGFQCTLNLKRTLNPEPSNLLSEFQGALYLEPLEGTLNPEGALNPLRVP